MEKPLHWTEYVPRALLVPIYIAALERRRTRNQECDTALVPSASAYVDAYNALVAEESWARTAETLLWFTPEGWDSGPLLQDLRSIALQGGTDSRWPQCLTEAEWLACFARQLVVDTGMSHWRALRYGRRRFARNGVRTITPQHDPFVCAQITASECRNVEYAYGR